MKIYLADQSPNFAARLDELKSQPVMPYEISALVEKTTAKRISATKKISDLDPTFLFAYEIFPHTIMTFLAEWTYERRNMRLGDTIVQQVCLPPHPRLSLKLILGVRINEIIAEPTRIGFSYETLVGHVEKGLSTFTIEQADDGDVSFRVHTFSRPAMPLAHFIGPIISIPYQTFATRTALQHVKRQLEK